MPAPVSDAFWQQVALDHHAVVRVSVHQPDGSWLADLATEETSDAGVVTTGSVDVDESRAIRRTLSLKILSQGVGNDAAALIPQVAGDLLHPGTANELRVFRGVMYPDNSTEVAALGVFRISSPVITDDTQGNGITMAITGNDRSSAISRNVWQTPYRIASGTNLTTAIHDALVFLAPWLNKPFNLALTDYVVPKTVWGGHKSSAMDPWADLQKLASAGGMELFFDPLGIPTLRPTPDVSQLTTQDTTFVEGDNCTMIQAQRILDETKTYNGVILRCHSNSGPPLTVSVWDDDPTSPTYYLGAWGAVPKIVDMSHIPAPGQSSADATAQAKTVARSIFRKVCRAMDEPSFQAVPNPALWEGDGFQLTRARIGLDAQYAISTMTMPLDIGDSSETGTPMQVGCRPQRVFATT